MEYWCKNKKMESLQIEQEIYGDLLVISPSGQLDALTADDLISATTHLVSAPIKYVVLNFEAISLIDSSGIGAMVSILKRTRSRAGDTVLANVGEQPMEVFKILNIHKGIAIYGTVEEAVSALGRDLSSRGPSTLIA